MGPETLADLDPRPAPVRSPSPSVNPLVPSLARACLAAVALACLAAAGLMLLAAEGSAAPVGVLYAALAAVAAALMRLPDTWLGHGLTGLLMLVTLTLGASAFRLGWGLGAPGLSLMGLMIGMLCAAAGWHAGAALATLAVLVLSALALGLPVSSPLAGMPGPLLQLGTHFIALAAGLACGVMVSRWMTVSRHSSQTREQRFKSLLGLAADGYWEIDDRYRMAAASVGDAEPQPLNEANGLGAIPWEMPQFGCDGEKLDALLADLDARLPFRDLFITWTLATGSQRHVLVSGEPRFDHRGVFRGYWGVVRDVSEMHNARAALEATETRYEELFAHIPTPLVLHRGGRVIEANPAAVSMFGHSDLKSMVGTDLLRTYQSGDSRERERRRLEALQNEPPGTALPVADFRLLVHGRVVSVRATTVLVDTEAGAAMLAIFVDDTERLAAEQAVRRSESMLAHLVATSPDLITLTEMGTGRFAMVNDTFARSMGWRVNEAVGRTAQELGLWGDTEAAQQFLKLMQEKGSVTHLPMPFVDKQGQTVPMLVSAARFVMDRREYMVINARDVAETERARLEREAILNSASIGIAVTRDARFVLTNPHFDRIHGWPPGGLIGQSGRRVWPDPALEQDFGPRLNRGEPIEFEAPAHRQDGSTFLARVRGRAIDPARPTEGGTAWIVEDVTEHRQFEQALARARDAAESASRAKSAFLANTSHELRTPLNGMIGLARMARAPDIGEDRRRQYLDQIAESAQALAGVISDILDLSKIEAGKLQLETTTFDLGELLRRLQQSYTTLAAAHGLRLEVEVDPSVQGMVSGDPLRVRQIISNYLNNALKFTAEGQVSLLARRDPDGDLVRVEVCDTGPGIDSTTRERLFEPFTQADQSTTRRFGGTGLGLSICRQLASLMGGSVGVHSEVGVGSTFWAKLPLPRAPQPQASRPAWAAGPAGGENPLQGARVLMVEDNPVNMLIAVAMLERWGVQVTQAQDGSEAVAAVLAAVTAGQPFDAVLMDVQMPVMSGHEATRALRALPQGRTLPIIALTAAALVSERDEALAAGMNDFLTKPIDAERLLASLLRWRGALQPG